MFEAFIGSIAGALVVSGAKGAQGPAQAIDDLMTIIGFDKLHTFAERKRAKNALDVQDYKNKIAEEITKVPEDNIKEPTLSIVGPALEASKYYIEEEELRDMFAKLIASSMDSSKDDSVKVSFVEIIKQLDVVDALHLYSIHNTPVNPVINIRLGSNNEVGSTLFLSNFFLSSQPLSPLSVCSSIDNLERLGLISVSYMNSYTNETLYSALIDKANILTRNEQFAQNSILKEELGMITITAYGKQFCSICL